MSSPLNRTGALLVFVMTSVFAGCGRDPSISLVELVEMDRALIEIAGDTRQAITPAFPAELSFDVDVPNNPTLKFSIALTTAKRAERARVDFRVRVVSEDVSVTVFRRTLRVDEHNQWHDASVNLAAWAGKAASLHFETFPARGKLDVPVWADRVTTVWGAPELVPDAPVTPPDRPSAILIVVDTLRHDYLGIHGFEGDISTNLDWLALESARFDNAFAPAPWTKPTVATLLSGLYPQTHGVRDQGGRINREATDTLSDEAHTLAEVFQNAGYDTAAFVGNAWLGPSYGFGQGFDTYFVHNHDGLLVDKARDWIASRDDDTPYFLYLHLINVHGPYRAPENDYLALRDSPSLSPDRTLVKGDPGRPRHFEATPFANADEKDQLRAWKAKYAATVRQLDRRLGALVGELRESGELQRTWVVFTSDHGEEFLEHGSWEHGYSLCDHQLHVPLWIREPGARSAGRRVPEVVSLLDVMPTILGASSLPIPDEAQGSDRSPWLLDTPRDSERTLAVGTGIMNRPAVHSLRTDRFHLLWDTSSDEIELFDTDTDPDESVNVASEQAELASRLKQLLRSQLEQIASAGTLETEVVPIPEDLRDRLRALGYIP